MFAELLAALTRKPSAAEKAELFRWKDAGGSTAFVASQASMASLGDSPVPLCLLLNMTKSHGAVLLQQLLPYSIQVEI